MLKFLKDIHEALDRISSDRVVVFWVRFWSGFLSIREFSGFRIEFGNEKISGSGFGYQLLPVRVRVLGSVCLLSLSVFFTFYFLYFAFSFATP